MALKWPFPDLFKPQIDSWQMTMPGVTRRTEFDEGEDRVRRTAHFRPHRQRFDIDIRRADLPVLRRWFYEDADGGRLWFEMSALVDDAYQTVEARIVGDGRDAMSARLVGDHDYRLSLEIEIRGLPRVADAEYYARQGIS
ncbi:hypothetical protein [Roseovarius ramblicola]|uniref:Uncharacterized protein n=1 Tax=Roseovarius ramblicola TaxID=2022336 RepID=A0ABV5HWQ5_9RHOB